ncbi:pseudomurein-binding repeat-containing protein [Methanobacterium sp.]|uniref:pseudomurein-binding repeat-containing protein n=1 Tax=Methanobacterium sp. TaxID=2164 RepID=UPI003C712FF6
MEIGGGIITKKLLFAALLISSLSLVGIAGAGASEMGTAQIQDVNNSTVKNLSINQTVNSVLQVSNKSTTQIAANSTVKSTNNSQTQQTINSTTSNANVSTQTQIAAAGEIKAVNSTSLTQINDAASRVKAYIETNHVLPNYVTIGTTQVKMPDFLKLLTAGLLQLNNGTTTSITLKTVGAPVQSSENVTSGNITKANYLDLAKRVNAFIDANGVVPNYANSNLGKLRYESLIYMYSKILNYYKTNNALPNYVSVKAWSAVTSVVTQARPVYITSDYINGATTDTNRINAIVNGLKALGLKAYNAGLGANTHYSVLQNSSVPANALIVDIYGGADAGVIYEMGQSYYKKLVGSRKVFSVWMAPSSVNITGLAWLPRAHDDNYSPASFTGLAHPDQYLLNNGYNYIYSGDLNAIIAAIYKQATT